MASPALDLARLEGELVRVDMFAWGRWRLEVILYIRLMYPNSCVQAFYLLLDIV